MDCRRNDLPDRGVYHGNSMSNVFVDGDILFFTDVPFGDLKCGDIVAVFERSPYYVHRIIRKKEDVAVTMGDNNCRPDAVKLNRDSRFRAVSSCSPGKCPARVFPVEGGAPGMKRFRHQQKRVVLRYRVRRILSSFRWLGRLRIPAKRETRFRDGTIQWSFGCMSVAACSPTGKTKYLGGWKRLFFRIPKRPAIVPGPCKPSQGEMNRGTPDHQKETGHEQ